MNLLSLSGNLLFVAFIAYLIATFFFGGAVKNSHDKTEAASRHADRWGKLAISITIIGFISHLSYFITRWVYTGHAPVSNMFEFTTAFGMFIVLAFIVMYFMYRATVIGLVALPIAILIIGYAAMFPTDASPLVPSLQSNWLTIHVITAALGQAVLSISALAGLVYLLKVVKLDKPSKDRFFLEAVMFFLVVVIGFVIASTTFSAMGYKAEFTYINKEEQQAQIKYDMPPIFGMNQYQQLTEGTMKPLIETPPLINAKKLTTVTWALLIGSVLYVLIRLIARRRVSAIFQPLVKRANLDLMDEIGYRSVLIGFPIFSLGALVFAMIWAQEAWGRFWGWDPKEVWALITWLFYAAFLHLRLSKGWEGKKSAWLAIVGFAIMIFNLVVINLIIAGLHSYA